MSIFERYLRKIDAFQQNHEATGLFYGVIKKYGDDNGGNLTIQLTYTLFVTIFPLLLLLITILTLSLATDASLRQHLLKSTFSEFPIVGSQLSSNIHVLKKDSVFGLVFAILALIYGSTALSGAGLYIMEQVWNIEGTLRPNFIKRLGRGLLFLITLALGLIFTTVLSGFGTFGRHNSWLGLLSEILAVAGNIALYFLAFKILTPRTEEAKSFIYGAVFGGIAWTILQAFGGYIVGHYLKNDNATYGVFGSVLGLVAWLYLGSEITVYAAEINTVVKRHLWPRSIVQPPLTKADQVSIALQATQKRRRPEQQVITKVKGRPTSEATYLKNKGKMNTNTTGTILKAPSEKKAPKVII